MILQNVSHTIFDLSTDDLNLSELKRMYQLAIDSRRVHILQNVSHTIFDLSLRNEFSRRSSNP